MLTSHPRNLDDALIHLKSLDWCSLSCQMIEEVLPSLGMNDEHIEEMPPELSDCLGRGLRFWQYPSQFAPLLRLLMERPVKSYLEIGTRWGGTFTIVDQILRRMNPALKSYAMDLIEEPPVLSAYSFETDFTYIQGDSQRAESWQSLPDTIDVIFIDGNHDYEAVRNDFNMAMKFCPHTVILHDTASDACPGVRLFWQDLRRIFTETAEFHSQYASVKGSFLGIGVILL